MMFIRDLEYYIEKSIPIKISKKMYIYIIKEF